MLFNFERKGIIVLDCGEDKEDDVFEVAADAGGDDIVPRDDGEEGFTVITEVTDFMVRGISRSPSPPESGSVRRSVAWTRCFFFFFCRQR